MPDKYCEPMTLKKLRQFFLILIIATEWVFSGWSSVYNFPSKVQRAYAAIGYGASSESHTGTAGATATYSWAHAGGASPRGVVVFVFNNANAYPYGNVTYGGVVMTAVSGGSAADTAGEPGTVRAYFLGSGIPTGDQTVQVVESGSMTASYAVAYTVTGLTDTEVNGVSIEQENQTLAEVNTDDGSPGTNSLRFAGVIWGASTVPTVGSNSTGGTAVSIDFGVRTDSTVRETTAGQGNRPVGWNTGTTSDDVAAVYLAIREIPPPPTFTQSAYRFFANDNSTNVGSVLANQDTTAALGSNITTFRLRTLLHIGNSQLAISGQAFKLQYVGKGTGTCASPSGGTPSVYTDVTTSTDIAYNDNATPTDGIALTANGNDPTHGTDTIVNQTYEELNNFTNSVNAIPSGQDGKWDFSLKVNANVPNTTYCFQVVKSDGSSLDTYTVRPEITTASEWITTSLGKTSDSWYGAIPVYMNLIGITNTNYPYARAKVDTPASQTFYTSMSWSSGNSRYEGTIYVGSNYCNGCADPTTGSFTVTAQLDNNDGFPSIDYSAGTFFSTYITRRWNAIGNGSMGLSTEFNPTWNTDHWDYIIHDLSIGGTAGAQTNVAFAIPFHPTTANINNIAVTIGGTSISQGTAASTSDCWYWDSAHHTLYVQKASVAASTYYTVALDFDSDTDLFMTRVDRVYTYNMGERLFYNGLLFGNKYIGTVMLGGGHEGSGDQMELQARDFTNDNDVSIDCMERSAVHVDNTIRNDSSAYYQADIKWKQDEWANYILSEDNNSISWVVNSDDTASTGWAQQLNNSINAQRTQTFYADARYVKNEYTFTNNSASSHIYPFVWGREQWLGNDRATNDQGRFAGDVSDVTVETHIDISTLTDPWMTSYDTGVFGAMGVIFQRDDPARYGYFLSAAALLNATPWAEWVNQGSEYRVDDNDSGTTAADTFFDRNYSSVAPSDSVVFIFWQWGYDDTSWANIETAIQADSDTLNPSANTAPTVSNVQLNGQSNINLTESTTISISATADISDTYGCSTISSVTAKIYRSGVSGAEACTANDNNCYSVASCTQNTCVGNDATYTCTANMQFFADPTDTGTPWANEYWKVYIEATDTGALVGSAYNTNGAPEVNSLLALSVTPTISYGNFDPGSSSTTLDQQTVVTSTGNISLDVNLYGVAMTSGGNSIAVGQQRYSLIASTVYASGTQLLVTPGVNVDTNICKNLSTTKETKDIWWGIAIPDPQETGTYSGSNTFSAVKNAWAAPGDWCE